MTLEINLSSGQVEGFAFAHLSNSVYGQRYCFDLDLLTCSRQENLLFSAISISLR